MVSLYRWTLFYWEQDRLGMLVPLLAIPFRNPLANLLVQSAVNAFCGLAAFFLCARYVMREGWFFTGAVSAAGFLWFNTKQALFQYLGLAQPYGVGLCLGLAGLLLLENAKRSRPLRISASLIFLLAASWVDAAVIFVLLPLVLFRCYLDCAAPTTFILRAKRCLNSNVALALALIFSSFVASYVLSGIVSSSAAYGDWPYSPMQPWRWPAVWIEFGKSGWSEYLSQGAGIGSALLLVLGVLLRLWPSLRTHAPNSPAANLLISSLISFLLMGSLSHVKSTEFEPRFALQSMVLLHVAAVAWALLPVYAFLRLSGRKVLTAAAMVLFLSAPIYVYGWPSLAKVRSDLDETFGKYTPEILQSGATHIVGNYWKVWPATFHVNMTLYEMGSDRRIWGVTTRSGPTRKFWSAIAPEKMRLVAIAGDNEARPMLENYALLPVQEERTFPDIVIFKRVSH